MKLLNEMKYLRNIIFIAVFIIGFIKQPNILAQDSDSVHLPSLGNHIFTSITGVEDPFISTKFILDVGLANLFNTEIPVTIPEMNETFVFKPQLFYAVGGIQFQYAVKDWAAIHLRAGGTARVGDNFISVVTQGISAASLFGIGLMFKLAENDDLFLSGAVELNNSTLTYISLQGKFEEIVSDSTSNQQVFNKFQILSGILQFRFAYELSRTLGVMANVSGSYGEVYAAHSSDDFNWSFGTLLSIDLKNWIQVPFGIGFGGTIISNDWQFSDTDDPVYTVNLNISFINQDDLSIAWENYIQMFKQDQYNKTYSFHYSRLYLSYYF